MMNQSSRSARILIVEDAPSLAESYAAYLRAISGDVEIVRDGEEAFASAMTEPPDVIVLDVNLPDGNGLDLLRRMREAGVSSHVVVVTGEGSIRLSVEAMRNGACDFLVKPFGVERLRGAVAAAIADREAGVAPPSASPNARLPHKDNAPGGVDFGGFIGKSERMQAVYRLLSSAAQSNASVFVTGESGTGKEVCAEALHRMSHRRNGPFVVINCAAIPRDLLESEIFGHAKGAFTGAVCDRKGAALQANGGTLFLDEVCEMDIALQSKLLRFLQDRQVRRLGEDASRHTDVRIVCATNRDPNAEVEAGRFREDLLYRLHVVPVELPPLRERGDDVVFIARSFLQRYAQEDNKRLYRFSRDAEAALLAYRWPGNIRQLQNVIRSIVVLNDGHTVEAGMLPPAIRAPAAPPPAVREMAIRPLDMVIRETIEYAIARCGGSIPKAAAALTVSPSTLYRRIQSWETGAAGG